MKQITPAIMNPADVIELWQEWQSSNPDLYTHIAKHFTRMAIEDGFLAAAQYLIDEMVHYLDCTYEEVSEALKASNTR